jgi:GNAT superfamily N-acetyltransferase
MFVVRLAVAGDVPSVAALERAAVNALESFRGIDVLLRQSPLINERWNDMIDSSDHLVFVGERESVILGFCLLKIATGEKRAQVRQIFVELGARDLGLGAQLLSACEVVARDKRCTYLEGFALPGDRETKNLFERFSMSAQVLFVGKKLD